MTSNWELRNEFLKLLTVDSPHQDRRRKDYNQGIFNAEQGWANFNGTNLDMVMDKFDRAIRNLDRRDKERHAQDMADIQLDEEQREQANANE